MDMLYHVHCNIFLSLKCEPHFSEPQFRSASFPFVPAYVGKSAGCSPCPVDLCKIEEFRKAMDSAAVECKCPVDRIIVFPATDENESIYEACKLLGAYLILTACMPLSAVVDAFHGLHDPFICDDSAKDVTALNCWQALDQSKRLGWLVDPKSGIEPALDVEAFAHYANRANGGVHMAVPGRLLFFPTTKALPNNQDWADITVDDGGTVRRFSPSFYAELFHDLGVSDVVCLGCSDPAAATVFAEHGIEVMDLGISAEGGSSLLHGLDLLLSLAAMAPGAVAVHSGDGFRWPAYTERLVAAFLISRLGFAADAATAWIRMLCPWLSASADAGAADAGAAAPPTTTPRLAFCAGA
jgi:hypothetical protein